MKQLKSQRGFADVILIVVVAVLVAGLGGYVYYQQKQANKTYDSAGSGVTVTKNTTKKTAAKTATQAVDPYTGWKTFTSPLSGYTIKYPSDWVVFSDGSIFKNGDGGTSSSLSIQNIRRTGSYDGHDANTYVCVYIDEYSINGWSGFGPTPAGLKTISSFSPTSGAQLTLGLEQGSPSILGSIHLLSGSNALIRVGSNYQFQATAAYNCVQGDNNALKNSTADFLSRPETKTAIQVLESLRYK